jgi:hypothetical protein
MANPTPSLKKSGDSPRRARRWLLPGHGRSGLWAHWLAAVLLLIASSASALTAMGHAPAGENLLQQHAVAAADSAPCGHSHAIAAHGQDGVDSCTGDGFHLHIECEQMCSFVGIFADVGAEVAPPGMPYLTGTRPDRLGQSPDGILRPPRPGMAA